MKPINENIFAIPVPMDAEDFSNDLKSSQIDFIKKEDGVKWGDAIILKEHFNDTFEILGTITATECSFDLTNIVSHCPIEGRFLKFKSLIESTTGYLFENNVSHPSDINPTSRNHYDELEKKWREHQDRVIEKLLIIEKK